jgi:hypothetical protein
MTRLPVAVCALLIMAAAHSTAAPATEHLTLGFHAHDPTHIEAATAAGYGAIRLWDTGTDWASLAPRRNLWNFDRAGVFIDASEKAHLKILWTLGSTPAWASARPFEKCAYGHGCAAEPADIDDWRHYVRTVATTFRGRIECYEIWNEASFPRDAAFRQPGDGGDAGQFFSGSIDSMVELTRVAFEEIHAADPAACVLSPSFHSSGHWVEKLDRFLDAGGGKYIDVASQHFYFGEEPEQSVAVIREVRRVLDKHGLRHIPIWNTEVGIPFSLKANQWAGMSLEDMVYGLTLRTYLINASEGILRAYWYAWDDGKFGFTEPRTGHDFGSEAAAAAIHVLDGFESVSCSERADVWRCRVHAGNRRFTVMWLAGKNAKPVAVTLRQNATRWGLTPALLNAGQKFALDGRPVIVDDRTERQP